MAKPALKFELEEPVEDRVGKLEVQVDYIQEDISNLKSDIRRLSDRIDSVKQTLLAKIEDVDKKLSARSMPWS
jgi:prefoldin subunit 5